MNKTSNFQHWTNEVRKNIKTNRLLKKGSAEFVEIEGIVSDYEKARGNGDEEISSMAQVLWYSNLLSKRAMARHNISLQETFKRILKKNEPSAMCLADGNHLRIVYDSGKCMEKKYYQNDRVIKKLRGGLKRNYVLANTKYENSKTQFCSNCGALCNRVEGYKGCSYCGTPLHIKEKHNKIVSIQNSLSTDWWHNRILWFTAICLAIMAICGNAVNLIQDGSLSVGITVAEIIYIVILTVVPAIIFGPVLGIFLANIIVVPLYIYCNKSNTRVERIGFEMRKYDENFSHTEFYGLAQTYLKIWLISKSKEELGCISQIENYCDNNIVDAECIRCEKVKISQDDQNHYIKLGLRVLYVKVDNKSKLKEEKKVFTITMKRKLGVKSSIMSETFGCSSCGSAVDILKNGNCDYCGTKTDLAGTNWVLEDCGECV